MCTDDVPARNQLCVYVFARAGAAFMGTSNDPELLGLTDSKEARGQYLAYFSEMCCTDRAETATKVYATIRTLSAVIVVAVVDSLV
jgi:hypothetical protein